MGLNDQSKTLNTGRGARKYIFKDGIRFSHMTGNDAKLFRLLPAFHPSSDDASRSWMPSIDEHGKLADFAMLLRVVRFVGHGKGGAGSRMDLLSLRTFGEDRFCPLTHLWDFINSDIDTWGYLIKDQGKRGDKDIVRAAFSRTTSQLVATVLDINQTAQGTQLGVFTQSASAALIGPQDGLVFKPNAMPGVEEFIKQNYMYAYANGDLTHPTDGAVLKCEKEDGKGDFSSYRVVVALDASGKVMRRAIDMGHMQGRINLSKPTDFMNIPTEEDIVNSLVQLLNGRSPQGYHEHALLKLAFPQFRIPEPPAAMASYPSVGNMGFAPSPAYVQPTTSAVPAFVPPAMPSAPAFVPPAMPSAPAFVPPATPTGGNLAGASVPAFTPPGAAVPQAPAPVPVVPGDPVGATFDQAGFMQRLKATTGATG